MAQRADLICGDYTSPPHLLQIARVGGLYTFWVVASVEPPPVEPVSGVEPERRPIRPRSKNTVFPCIGTIAVADAFPFFAENTMRRYDVVALPVLTGRSSADSSIDPEADNQPIRCENATLRLVFEDKLGDSLTSSVSVTTMDVWTESGSSTQTRILEVRGAEEDLKIGPTTTTTNRFRPDPRDQQVWKEWGLWSSPGIPEVVEFGPASYGRVYVRARRRPAKMIELLTPKERREGSPSSLSEILHSEKSGPEETSVAGEKVPGVAGRDAASVIFQMVMNDVVESLSGRGFATPISRSAVNAQIKRGMLLRKVARASSVRDPPEEAEGEEGCADAYFPPHGFDFQYHAWGIVRDCQVEQKDERQIDRYPMYPRLYHGPRHSRLIAFRPRVHAHTVEIVACARRGAPRRSRYEQRRTPALLRDAEECNSVPGPFVVQSFLSFVDVCSLRTGEVVSQFRTNNKARLVPALDSSMMLGITKTADKSHSIKLWSLDGTVLNEFADEDTSQSVRHATMIYGHKRGPPLVISLVGPRLVVWDVETGQVVFGDDKEDETRSKWLSIVPFRTFPDAGAGIGSFGEGGFFATFHGSHRSVAIWDVRTPQKRVMEVAGDRLSVSTVTLARDGLLIGGRRYGFVCRLWTPKHEPSSISLFDLRNPSKGDAVTTKIFAHPGGEIQSICRCPGRRSEDAGLYMGFATGYPWYSLSVVDPLRGKLLAIRRLGRDVEDLLTFESW